MKQIPFDINRVNNPNIVIRTKDGVSVTVVYTNFRDSNFSIVAVQHLNDKDVCWYYTSDGKSFTDNSVSPDDLEMFELDKKSCCFKPFDKVLVRDNDGGMWRPNIFSHYLNEYEYPFFCILSSYKQCIPYNEETKNLVNTKNAPDQKYIIW